MKEINKETTTDHIRRLYNKAKPILVVALFAIIGGVLSCSYFYELKDDNNIILTQEYHEWNISPLGERVRLWCEPEYDGNASEVSITYAWYQCLENEKIKIINEYNYYDTPKFLRPEIRRYCCVVTLYENVNGIETSTEKVYDFYIAYTGIPTLYITTDDSQPIESKTEKIHGTVKIVSSKYNSVISEMLVNGRGNTGWDGTPKKSYNIKLPEKVSFLGMAKSRKWALIDNYHDRSLLRNSYVSYLDHNVFTNLGWNPSYKHVDVVLNGDYIGNYLLAERIKIEKNG